MPPTLTQAQAAVIIRDAVQRLDPQFDFPDDEVTFWRDQVLIGVNGVRVTDRICELLFPKAPSAIYYHFTKFDSFSSIISSATIWLHNLHKRFKDAEFRLFCEDHGLDGYLARSTRYPTRLCYQELMDDLFSLSLVADAQKNSDQLWWDFGDCHKGVRLGFDVRADNHPDFRRIAYQTNKKLPFFHQLQQEFGRFELKFLVAGVSRFPAYYICSDFREESEWRLLLKKQDDGGPFPFTIHPVGTDHVKFIECGITGATCPEFQLRLVGVTSGTQCDHAKVEAAVRASQHFSTLPVTRA